MRRHHKKYKRRSKVTILLLIIIFFLSFLLICFQVYNKEQLKLSRQEEIEKEIKQHYSNLVITNKEANLYKYKDNEYIVAGSIAKGEELTLKKLITSYQNDHFKIKNFDGDYYIFYNDVDKAEKTKTNSQRYKNYIPWNLVITSKDITNFYNESDELIYSFHQAFSFPVIVKQDNKYGVEFNNQLLYIKKEDIAKVEEKKNTDKKNTTGIAVLNYHFFYDSDNPSDECNQTICLSTKNLKKHLDYIKSNNIFTPTLKELEMYIDGEIKLPKSVVITIDDGWRAGIGSKVITEYKLNATIFLMSYHYDPRNYQNEYIEVHSHGHDIHNPGICPGGQGGAIKCMNRESLLKDLKASREKLNNTTYFCYPFYEYNDYSISVLKEAGFTMAFGGENEDGKAKAEPGINKFKIPRYVIINTTTAADLASYIN